MVGLAVAGTVGHRWGRVLISPSPLIPLPSRERGRRLCCHYPHRPVDSRLRGNDGPGDAGYDGRPALAPVD